MQKSAGSGARAPRLKPCYCQLHFGLIFHLSFPVRNELKGHGPVPRIKGVSSCELSVRGSSLRGCTFTSCSTPQAGAHSDGPTLSEGCQHRQLATYSDPDSTVPPEKPNPGAWVGTGTAGPHSPRGSIPCPPRRVQRSTHCPAAGAAAWGSDLLPPSPMPGRAALRRRGCSSAAPPRPRPVPSPPPPGAQPIGSHSQGRRQRTGQVAEPRVR